jgi:predicted RND superfamily exporter protein
MQQESEYQKAQTEIIKWLKQSQEIRRKNKMSSKIFEALKPISKAVAGALAAIIAGFAAKLLGSFYTPEVSDSIGVIVNSIVLALVGFLVVYFSPKNK